AGAGRRGGVAVTGLLPLRLAVRLPLLRIGLAIGLLPLLAVRLLLPAVLGRLSFRRRFGCGLVELDHGLIPPMT
ncbi:hypothetical protein, partial [Streptomyces purpurogeneiscleroticus]|uniref:hypothetical protein n=1 Tax=Streptomyces purpurogeneiscleroticus TaxID=68259 RepID=UPI001CC1663A